MNEVPEKIMYCDICGDVHVYWFAEFAEPVELDLGGVREVYDSIWAFCPGCADAMRNRDIGRMVARGAAPFADALSCLPRSRERALVVEVLRKLYEQLATQSDPRWLRVEWER